MEMGCDTLPEEMTIDAGQQEQWIGNQGREKKMRQTEKKVERHHPGYMQEQHGPERQEIKMNGIYILKRTTSYTG